MRKTFFAIIMISGLAGCATDTSGTKTIDVGQVQQIAQTVCGFVPTAETVLGIFASSSAIYQTATSIANAICAAVTTKSARRGVASAPTVNGVVVHGTFVKGGRRR